MLKNFPPKDARLCPNCRSYGYHNRHIAVEDCFGFWHHPSCDRIHCAKRQDHRMGVYVPSISPEEKGAYVAAGSVALLGLGVGLTQFAGKNSSAWNLGAGIIPFGFAGFLLGAGLYVTAKKA